MKIEYPDIVAYIRAARALKNRAKTCHIAAEMLENLYKSGESIGFSSELRKAP